VTRLIASMALPLALVASVAVGQPAPSFEVASIRLNNNAGEKGNIEFAPGGERFAATNVPLSLLIVTAYNVTLPQFSWQNSALPVLSERYDIQAKAEHPVSGAEMLRLLQSLLEDRFKLVVRRETKELQSYALVVDKGGPRLHVSDVPHFNDAALSIPTMREEASEASATSCSKTKPWPTMRSVFRRWWSWMGGWSSTKPGSMGTMIST
jgi:uncharacterized protein (TIGR03435 family)